MRALNGKLYTVCENCGSIIRLNKPIVGGLHFCYTDEELRTIANNPHLAQQRDVHVQAAKQALARA